MAAVRLSGGAARPAAPTSAAGDNWTVEKVPGGYEVTGRWNFASGFDHARWLYCTCTTPGPDGAPVLRAVWIPREQVTMVDTWSVMGMRGTGSQDFTEVSASVRHFLDLVASPTTLTGRAIDQHGGLLDEFTLHR